MSLNEKAIYQLLEPDPIPLTAKAWQERHDQLNSIQTAVKAYIKESTERKHECEQMELGTTLDNIKRHYETQGRDIPKSVWPKTIETYHSITVLKIGDTPSKPVLQITATCLGKHKTWSQPPSSWQLSVRFQGSHPDQIYYEATTVKPTLEETQQALEKTLLRGLRAILKKRNYL